MRDTLKSITENTSISFGLMMSMGAALLYGYSLVLDVKYKAEVNALAIQRLETQMSEIQRSKDDISQIKTDLAVIKANIENMNKNLPNRKN